MKAITAHSYTTNNRNSTKQYHKNKEQKEQEAVAAKIVVYTNTRNPKPQDTLKIEVAARLRPSQGL